MKDKKPTLEEVKEKFKNAKEVVCFGDKKVYDISNWNRYTYHDENDGDFNINVSTEKDESFSEHAWIYHMKKGYAKIITYKKPKFRPIAMRCNQEQFDAVKGKLKGKIKFFTSSPIGNFNSVNFKSYLTNYYNREISISSTFSPDCYKETEVHETWNEKVFLEACGIVVKEPKEETFVITKEQIWDIDNFGYSKVKEWFPSVFVEDKKELVLEAGKWYKKGNLLCLIKCIDASGRYFQRFHCYGFNTLTGYDNFCFDVNNGEHHCFELATAQEVEEALKNEAVKKYKTGDYVNPFNIKCSGQIDTGYMTELKDNSLWFGGYEVFKDGQWAEIIPQITPQEAEQKLENKFKIV